jgi:drug/metabolite transporter (DMT)-like permease
MLREIVLLCFVVGAGTMGELCISRGMKTVGEVRNFSPGNLLYVILQVIRVKWIWLGFSLEATAFFCLLWVLSFANVSLVVPVTSMSYAAGALGGKIFLREKVTRGRWTGILLVTVGVILVLVGRS